MLYAVCCGWPATKAISPLLSLLSFLYPTTKRTKVKKGGKMKVLPRFELGLAESEPAVITNYTIEPLVLLEVASKFKYYDFCN